ncbi:MAG: hypothetical protein ACD_23C00326G0001, partial [uncultured bacterium]
MDVATLIPSMIFLAEQSEGLR